MYFAASRQGWAACSSREEQLVFVRPGLSSSSPEKSCTIWFRSLVLEGARVLWCISDPPPVSGVTIELADVLDFGPYFRLVGVTVSGETVSPVAATLAFLDEANVLKSVIKTAGSSLLPILYLPISCPIIWTSVPARGGS